MEQVKFISKELLAQKCDDIFSNHIAKEYCILALISSTLYSVSKDEAILEMKNSLELLAEICSCMLNIDSISIFLPSFSHGNRRSFLPEDLSIDELHHLIEIVDVINEPILKARIADILWSYQKPKNIRYARLAIESYISINDFAKYPMETYDFWHRATSLAKSTKQTDLLNRIKDKLLQEFDNPSNNNWSFHKLKIAKIFLKTELDKTIYEYLAEEILLEQEKYSPKSDDFNIIESYLILAQELFDKSGNKDKKIECINLLAKSNEQHGDFKTENSYIVARHFYNSALQIYRRIPDNYRQKFNTEKSLLNIQHKITQTGYLAINHEFYKVSSSSYEVDVEQSQQKSINHVKNKSSLFEALMYFSGVYNYGGYQNLLKQEQDNLGESILRLFPSVVFSKDGREVACIEALNDSNHDTVAFQSAIQNFARIHINIAVVGYILPALFAIQDDYLISKEWLIRLCYRSSIVPKKRERLVATALYYGFEQDFATCIHLLSPQVENMVRQLFKKQGIKTTQIDEKNIEQEVGLSSLLNKSEARDILGDDLWFELQVLFTSSLGVNLRNEVAHGLLDDESSNSYFSIYAWWLILKLVIWSR